MKRKGIIILGIIALVIVVLTATPDSRIDFPQKIQMATNLNASDWTEPINVSTSPNPSYFPKVVGDSHGNAYVIWLEEIPGKKIYFNTNESGIWEVPENVTRGEVEIKDGPWPEITVDNNEIVCIAYTAVTAMGVDRRSYEAVYNRRRNGEWDGHENVSKTVEAGSVSPTLLVDMRSNDYFVIWQDDIDRPSEMATFWQGYIRYKEGGSGDWIGAGVIRDPSGRGYSHHAAMDSGGKAYVVWANRSATSSRIFFSQNATPKVNSGWTVPMLISGLTGINFAAPQIACDNNGNLYVVWMQDAGGTTQTFFTKRINGVWENIENISQTDTTSEFPTITVSKDTGDIYVAWQERLTSSWDIYYREYKNGRWQNIENLSNSSSRSSQPNLSVDAFGGVHLVFNDNRTGSGNIFYQKKEGVYDFPCYPPLSLQLTTSLDHSATTKINTLIWEENPLNEQHSELQHVIYRKEEGQANNQYEQIATVSGDTYIYRDDGLTTTKKYWYTLKSLSVWDEESEEASNAVTEIWIWPVLDLYMQTQLNRFLFYQEKINTVSWSSNPLNNAITVDRYDIYRKRTTQDTEYALLTSVHAGVYEYRDRGLLESEQYSYTIVSIDTEGNESTPCEPVSED